MLQQTLHGYDEGHRLLASSIKLSANEQKYLLESTDLSGHRTKGFDQYLTGYPIPDSDKYALSKTWYAYEMKRPGCVWTHTLLLNPDDFRKFINLRHLINYFKCPEKENFQDYNVQLNDKALPNILLNSKIIGSSSDFRLYSNVFNTLFEKIKNVVLVANNSKTYEDFILSLWTQMWADLRFNFSFSTGVLSSKSSSNVDYAIQVVPTSNTNQFYSKNNQINKFRVIDDHINIDSLNGLRYRRMFESYQNILKGTNFLDDKMLEFVWYYGKQLQPYRKNFGWLSKFYELLVLPNNEKGSFEDITKAIAGKFPNAQDQQDLKLLLFGSKDQITDTKFRYSEVHSVFSLAEEPTLINYMLKIKNVDFLDSKTLKLSDRFKDYWKKYPHEAKSSLHSLPAINSLNVFQLNFLSISAKFIDQISFTEIISDNLDLANELLERNIALASNEKIWIQSVSFQKKAFKLFKVKTKRELNNKDISPKWKKVICSMFKSNNAYFMDELSELFGEKLLLLFLDWYSKNNNLVIDEKWFCLLFRFENEAMNWVAKNKKDVKTKMFLTQVLNPYSKNIMDYGTLPWIDINIEDFDGISEYEKLKGYAFLLSLGLMNIDKDSKKLVSKFLVPVYEAVRSDLIPQEIWNYLKPVIPYSGMFARWDKCRRLEEAVVGLILYRKWKVDIILDIGKTKYILFNLTNRICDHYKGRRKIRGLAKRIKNKKVSLEVWQKELILEYID